MQNFRFVGLVIILTQMTFCATQKEEPEFSAGGAFRLASGGLLSLPDYDESSPQLLQHPDGFLSLLFVSNRPCNNGVNCSSGTYNVFLARSTQPYNGGRLPPFTEPLTIKDSSDYSMASDSVAFNIAAYTGGNTTVYIFVKSISTMNVNSVNVANAIYSSENYDSNLSSHVLLGYDPYNDKLFTEHSGGIYYTTFGTNPGQPLAFHQQIPGDVYSIAALPNGIYSQGNAFFYSDGVVSMGTNDAPMGLPHLSIGLAQTRYLMDIREVAVLKANTPGNEVFVFSGQSMRNGDNSFDLYAIQDYNARQLWQMGMQEYGGFDFMALPQAEPLLVFVTSNSYYGNLGNATNADNNCNTDSAKPPLSFYPYRAVIIGSPSFGRSSITEVLKPNRTYIADVTPPDNVVFTTGADSKIAMMDDNTHLTGDVWTGLDADQDASSNNCNNWTDNTSAYGSYGDTGSTSIGEFVSVGDDYCSTGKKLLCVEYPGP